MMLNVCDLKRLKKLQFGIIIILFVDFWDSSTNLYSLCLSQQQIKTNDQIPSCQIKTPSKKASLQNNSKLMGKKKLDTWIFQQNLSFYLVNHFLVCGFWFPTKRFLNGMSYVINDSYCTVRFLQLILWIISFLPLQKMPNLGSHKYMIMFLIL